VDSQQANKGVSEMFNLYLSTVRSFLNSLDLESIQSVELNWFENGYLGVRYNELEFADLDKYFNQLDKKGHGPEIKIVLKQARVLLIRRVDGKLYMRPVD
jgi:hypothetical protein